MKKNIKENSIIELVDSIDTYVDSNFNDFTNISDIEKWNTIPKLLLLSEKDQIKFLDFCSFIDYLDIDYIDKVKLINTTSSILDYSKMKLSTYENEDLYLLSYYYLDKSVDEITDTIELLSNKKILYAVRNEFLDLEKRKKLLFDIQKRYFSGKIEAANKNISTFSSEIKKEYSENI